MKKLLTSLSIMVLGWGVTPDVVAMKDSSPALVVQNTPLNIIGARWQEFHTAYRDWISHESTSETKQIAQNALFEFVDMLNECPINQMKVIYRCSLDFSFKDLVSIVFSLKEKDRIWLDRDIIPVCNLLAQMQQNKISHGYPPMFSSTFKVSVNPREYDVDLALLVNRLCETKILSGLVLDFWGDYTEENLSFFQALNLRCDDLTEIDLRSFRFRARAPRLVVDPECVYHGVGQFGSLRLEGMQLSPTGAQLGRQIASPSTWRGFLDNIRAKKISELVLIDSLTPESKNPNFWRVLRCNDNITSLEYFEFGISEQTAKLASTYLPRNIKTVTIASDFGSKEALEVACSTVWDDVYSNMLSRYSEITEACVRYDDFKFSCREELEHVLANPVLCQGFYRDLLSLKELAHDNEGFIRILALLSRHIEGDRRAGNRLLRLLRSAGIDYFGENYNIYCKFFELCSAWSVEFFIGTYGSKDALMLQAALAPSLKELNFCGVSVVPPAILQKVTLQDRIKAAIECINPAFANIDDAPALVSLLENLVSFRKSGAEIARLASAPEFEDRFAEMFFVQHAANLATAIKEIGNDGDVFIRLRDKTAINDVHVIQKAKASYDALLAWSDAFANDLNNLQREFENLSTENAALLHSSIAERQEEVSSFRSQLQRHKEDIIRRADDACFVFADMNLQPLIDLLGELHQLQTNLLGTEVNTARLSTHITAVPNVITMISTTYSNFTKLCEQKMLSAEEISKKGQDLALENIIQKEVSLKKLRDSFDSDAALQSAQWSCNALLSWNDAFVMMLNTTQQIMHLNHAFTQHCNEVIQSQVSAIRAKLQQRRDEAIRRLDDMLQECADKKTSILKRNYNANQTDTPAVKKQK